MRKSFPLLITRLAIFAALILPASIFAQTTSSSARYIPNEVEKADTRASQVIDRAETYFKEGELHLKSGERDQARDKFDKAVDTVLESGMDVRGNQRLQTYYLELVERIYRIEVPSQLTVPQSVAPSTVIAQNDQTPVSSSDVQQTQPAPQQVAQIGFREQKFEPSPLDELSKLVLTPEEQNVSPEDAAQLEIAKSAVNFNFATNPLIQQYINYYQGRGRSTMEAGLRRSGRFLTMARRIFRQEGVPEDIAWLGQVESAWRPTAVSWAAASGLWQFVPSTGRQYGLRQTAWVDERNSFEKATQASARYLRWLANRYKGNWELAMAAYNTGEGNVDRAISRAGSSNYWDIYPYIAQETRNYVPNILATILIAKNPEKYGFRGIKPEAPMGYDRVLVPSATSLQLIADATDTSVDYLRSINPELRRDVTPRGEAYEVRIPGGKAKQFQALLRRVPANARETARVISVGSGEELKDVAQRTGVSLQVLQVMNNGVEGKAHGGKIVVPNSTVRAVALVRAKPAGTQNQGDGLTKVKARAGDTIAKVAARYNVSAEEMARLNGKGIDEEIGAGEEIKVPQSANAQPSSPAPVRRRRRG